MKKKILKIRKKIARLVIELGMIIMPEFTDTDYLDILIYDLNVRHCRVKCRKGDGSPLDGTEEKGQ